MKIVVIGSTGMLGFAIHRVLHDAGYDVVGTRRTEAYVTHPWCAGLRGACINDLTDPCEYRRVLEVLRPDVVINAAGIIKQIVHESDPASLIAVNAVFPRRLEMLGETLSFRIIQFSTDCVFQGKAGRYRETDIPDASDAYGVSKWLGELRGPISLTLRTSLIGRGIEANRSLIDWFLGQKGVVLGFSKVVFSGLPVNEIARVVRDRVLPRISNLQGLYHLSSDAIDKYALLQLVRDEWARRDIDLRLDDRVTVDRSLNSERFRDATGYCPPKWVDMIGGMRRFYESLGVG